MEPLWHTFRLKWSFLSTILAPIAKKVKCVKTVKTLSKTYVFEGWRRSFWRLFGICLRQFSLTRCQSIFTSILGAFWAHFRLMLVSFSNPFSSCIFTSILVHFWRGGDPPGGVLAARAEHCEPWGILHFGVQTVIFLCVFQHSGKVVAQRPRDSHLSDLSQVTLQVPLGSCTGNFKKGGHWHKVSPHAGDGAKVASRRGGFSG